MDKRAQRIAIAKVRGWTDIKEPHGFAPEPYGFPPGRTNGEREDIPDYLNDLDAMHEAEKILTPAQFFQYEKNITTLVGSRDQKYYLNLHATAAQRAEAFLKTLGLWVP